MDPEPGAGVCRVLDLRRRPFSDTRPAACRRRAATSAGGTRTRQTPSRTLSAFARAGRARMSPGAAWAARRMRA